jgi:hypothetical protein
MQVKHVITNAIISCDPDCLLIDVGWGLRGVNSSDHYKRLNHSCNAHTKSVHCENLLLENEKGTTIVVN